MEMKFVIEILKVIGLVLIVGIKEEHVNEWCK